MEHVVFFPAADGTSGFRCVPSLEEAVRFVEHLRNVEGVDGVSVHALTPVPLQFRAYYRVEVPAEPVPSAPVEVPAVSAPIGLQLPAQARTPKVEQVAAEPVEVTFDEPVPSLALVEDLAEAEAEVEVEVDAVAEAPPAPAVNGAARETVPSLGFFA